MPHSSAALPPSSTGDFTAVLLGGGRSFRMGFDKATLLIDGQPLWQRQLETLRATGPDQLLISGRLDGPYSISGLSIIPDELPSMGPLGGLATVLTHAKHSRILVLAMDLPDMTAEWLARLVCNGPAIPLLGAHVEPLAAVYPKAAAPLARQALAEGRLSLRGFAQRLFEAGLATPWPVPPGEAGLFRNLNTPADVAQRSKEC